MRTRTIAVALMMAMSPVGLAGATTYEVGPGKAYASYGALPALNPGDVVNIYPGTYHTAHRFMDSGTAENPIIIHGMGGPGVYPLIDGTNDARVGGARIDCATAHGTIPVDDSGNWICDLDSGGSRPRAMLQVDGAHYVIDHLEIVNTFNNDENCNAFRLINSDGTIIRDCLIHDNDQGFESIGSGSVVIESCHIYRNGSTQYSHNLYMDNDDLTVRYCLIHDTVQGINVKTRSHYAKILYNLIYDSDQGEIDIIDSPTGAYGQIGTSVPHSNALVMGNFIATKHNYNHYSDYNRIVNFGCDTQGVTDHNGTLYLINNTIVAGAGVNEFVQMTQATNAYVVAINNIFYGSRWINGVTWPVPSGHFTGSNNWVQIDSVIPPGFTGTVVGANPGFVDLANRDFHIGSWSRCRNAGAVGATSVDGNGTTVSGVPVSYYAPPSAPVVTPPSSQTRAVDPPIDIGAFEADLSVPAPDAATIKLDFGTDTSPVKSGWSRVTGDGYDPSRGWGWHLPDASYLVASRERDHGDYMLLDFIFSNDNDPITFTVDVPPGHYSVVFTMGDIDYGHAIPTDVYLNGVNVYTLPSSTGSGRTQDTFAYNWTNTESGLDFRLVGSGGAPSGIAGLQVVPYGTTLDPSPNLGWVGSSPTKLPPHPRPHRGRDRRRR